MNDLPAGFYALTMTDLEDGLVLDAIDGAGVESLTMAAGLLVSIGALGLAARPRRRNPHRI